MDVSFFIQCNLKHTKINQLKCLLLDKCRNDVPKDDRKIESAMTCFVRGVRMYPPVAFIPVYRLQFIGLNLSRTYIL